MKHHRQEGKGGTLPPSESFCMCIEYYLENHIPDLLRTPDSLKRSLSFRPSAMQGPRYPGAAMAGEAAASPAAGPALGVAQTSHGKAAPTPKCLQVERQKRGELE